MIVGLRFVKGQASDPLVPTGEHGAPRVVADAMARGCVGRPPNEMPRRPTASGAGGKVALPSSFQQDQRFQPPVSSCLFLHSPLCLDGVFTQNANGQREAKAGASRTADGWGAWVAPSVE